MNPLCAARGTVAWVSVAGASSSLGWCLPKMFQSSPVHVSVLGIFGGFQKRGGLKVDPKMILY